MEGEASIHTASEMVDLLSKEKQEELLNGTEEKVTLEMVRKKAEEAHQEGWITPQRFQKDTKEILKIDTYYSLRLQDCSNLKKR